jgi:hypothetical protein
MKKLFGLFLLGLTALAPDLAQAAARFAVCTTTCTWDNTSTAMWSTTSGGATGASAPVAADDVTLDANTCVGGTTCTITTFAGTISITSLTMSNCTASTAGCILDASANNTNFTISGSSCYANGGSGTRTLNMGNGTWTCSSNTAFWSIVASSSFNANSSTLAFTGTGGTSSRRFTGGAKTYNVVSVASGSSAFIPSGATITTFTVSPGNRINLAAGASLTITTLTNIAGSSSAQTLFNNENPTNGASTISSANNWTCDWCGFSGMTFSGGGTFAGTNSFSFNQNTGITITAPSGGGGGGGRIIGG